MSEPNEQEEVLEQLVALGYVDPGEGSSVWQAMLARFFILKKWFGKKETDGDDEE